jgi:uncharacterized protein
MAHGQHSGPLLLMGESLGAAVAAAAGAAQRELTAGLVLITPWYRLLHVALHHCPWLPARLGEALRATLGGPKHPMTIDGAGHNDWPDRVDDAWWCQATDLAK